MQAAQPPLAEFGPSPPAVRRRRVEVSLETTAAVRPQCDAPTGRGPHMTAIQARHLSGRFAPDRSAASLVPRAIRCVMRAWRQVSVHRWSTVGSPATLPALETTLVA